MADEQPDEGIVEGDENEPQEVETEEESEVAAKQASIEEDDEDSEEQPDPSPEVETVEYEGQEYNIPPELKDAIMRQSDYTTKTQEVAEQRKDLETDRMEAQAEIQKDLAQAQSYGTVTNYPFRG